MKKRTLLFLVCAIMAMTALCGCKSEEEKQAEALEDVI